MVRSGRYHRGLITARHGRVAVSLVIDRCEDTRFAPVDKQNQGAFGRAPPYVELSACDACDPTPSCPQAQSGSKAQKAQSGPQSPARSGLTSEVRAQLGTTER